MSASARPDPRVSTEWVALHYADPDVMVIEVGDDARDYARGHIPGALLWEWPHCLHAVMPRGAIITARLEALLGRSGIDNYTTVLLYGDGATPFAADAFRLLQSFGHRHLGLMEGGRATWLSEGRPLTNAVPGPMQKTYRAKRRRTHPDFDE
jgi:thiosulfate/3-mercaptopyruvate sulfurtransferase